MSVSMQQKKWWFIVVTYENNDESYSGRNDLIFESDVWKRRQKIMYINYQYDKDFTSATSKMKRIKQIKNTKKWSKLYIYFKYYLSIRNKYSTKNYHQKKFNELLLKLRPNYYKVGIVFATYQRMRAKWTSWAGTSHIGIYLNAHWDTWIIQPVIFLIGYGNYTQRHIFIKHPQPWKLALKEEMELMQKLWTTKDQILLERIKEDIMTGLSLAITEPHQRFHINTDYTKYGLGAVLLQAYGSVEARNIEG